MDSDIIMIGNKPVKFKRAMKYYADPAKCQHKLGLTGDEYRCLIDKLLAKLEGKEPQSGYMSQFNHSILPDTYTTVGPASKNGSTPQMAIQQHPPSVSATHLEQNFGTVTHGSAGALNQNLLDRRFFGGGDTIVNPRPATRQPVVFNINNASQHQRWQQAYQEQLGNEQIFSRTFDMANYNSMPNVTMERQSMGCRRGGNRLY